MLIYKNTEYNLVYSGTVGLYFLSIPKQKIFNIQILAKDGKSAIEIVQTKLNQKK